MQPRNAKAALAGFEKAAEMGNSNAWVSPGGLLGESGHLEAAIEAHMKAVQLMPENPMSHFLLGDKCA